MRLSTAAMLFFFWVQDNNVVVRTWGTPREDAGLLSHVDLVQHLGIVDLDAGNYQSPAFRWS
jgi:seryl-tRNA synthetase